MRIAFLKISKSQIFPSLFDFCPFLQWKGWAMGIKKQPEGVVWEQNFTSETSLKIENKWEKHFWNFQKVKFFCHFLIFEPQMLWNNQKEWSESKTSLQRPHLKLKINEISIFEIFKKSNFSVTFWFLSIRLQKRTKIEKWRKNLTFWKF